MSPLDENTIRLAYGPVHLEFLLLSENKAAIRDGSPHQLMAFGLEAFWKRHCDGDLSKYRRPIPSSSVFAGPISPPHIAAHSPYNPHSLQPQRNPSPMTRPGMSPAATARMSLSVPPPITSRMEEDDRLGFSSTAYIDRLPTTKDVLVLEAAALEKAMMTPEGMGLHLRA